VIIGVLLEKVLDIIILLSFSIVGLFFLKKIQYYHLFFFVFGIIIIVFFIKKCPINFTYNNRNLNKSIMFFFDNLSIILKKPLIIVYSVIIRFINIINVILLFYALKITPPFFYSVTTIPLGILIGSLPLSVGGMGTRDAAFIYLFSDFSPAPQIFSAGIFYSIIFYILPAIIGVLFIRLSIFRKQE